MRLTDGQLVSYNGKGWHLYDFREKQSEVYAPELSLETKLALLKQAREATQEAAGALELPEVGVAMPHPKDWPLLARTWLYKAGINNDDIANLGIYWAPRMQRVVMPLTLLNFQDGWIARTVASGTAGPKYLFPYGFRRGGGAQFLALGDARSSGVVITEDPLSAFRIARDTDYDAVSALGTSLDTAALVQIAGDYRDVAVWLDPDKYGRHGAREIAGRLNSLGANVRNIRTERDPKLYDAPALIEALEV